MRYWRRSEVFPVWLVGTLLLTLTMYLLVAQVGTMSQKTSCHSAGFITPAGIGTLAKPFVITELSTTGSGSRAVSTCSKGTE